MLTSENSQPSRKSAKLAEVGRPRTRPPGETLSLGIKVDPKLAEALDAEVKVMNAEQPPGRAGQESTAARWKWASELVHLRYSHG